MDLSSASLHHIFGIDSSIKRNILPIHYNGHYDPKELLYLAGKYVVKVNIKNGERKYALNKNCERLGCMTLYEEIIYIGEVGTNSSILICSISDLQILGTLDGGSDVGYSCLDASKDGKFLCSVGIKSDHSLIVWDLNKMTIILRTKACGQDVYHAAFSPHDCSVITTAGKGHMRFWKMAETFTGLKLQGKFGKFGKVDVCNVQSFLHLQNGRTISGSDSGYLFLWEDGFLKLTFILGCSESVQEKDAASDAPNPIHKGGVNYLYHDEGSRKIITAGADSSIKWWAYDDIVSAEPDEFESHCIITPTNLISLNNGASDIKYIVPFGLTNFIVQDTEGKVFMIDVNEGSVITLWNFHGGNITGIDISPKEFLSITCGDDGFVHCCNFQLRKVVSSIKFPLQCTQITWCPQEVDSTERSIVVGFSDGSFKFLYVTDEKIIVLESVRPHKSKVTMINFRHCGHLLFTSDDTGELFIFNCNQIRGPKNAVEPIGYVECKESIKSSIRWQNDKKAIQYTQIDGTEMEVDLTERLLSWEKCTTKDITMTYRLQVHHMKLSPINQESDDTIHTNIPILDRESFDGKFLIRTGPNGIVSILSLDTNGVNDDDPLLVDSQNEDGRSSLVPKFTFLPCGKEASTLPSSDGFVNKSSRLHLIEDFGPRQEQPESCTLEELLVKQYEDSKIITATKRKTCIRRVINDMRTEFINIHQLNSSLPSGVKLPASELMLNSSFNIMYSEMLERKISEVDAKHRSETEQNLLHRRKLEEMFLDDLDTAFVVVSSIRRRHEVQSIPILKFNDSFTKLKKDLSLYSGEVATKKNRQTVMSSSCTKTFADEAKTLNIEIRSPKLDENRKVARMNRKEAIETKITQSPTGEDDPVYVKALEEAKANLGDWELKSSNSYKVPMEKQVNLQRKLKEMIDCGESIYISIDSFNSRLILLKRDRLQLVQDVKRKNARKKEIDNILGANEVKDHHTSNHNQKISSRFASNKLQLDTRQNVSKLLTMLPQLIEIPRSLFFTGGEDLSNLEKDEILERNVSLEFERSKLSKDIEEMIKEFDETVYTLSKERFQLLLETKAGEINLYNMFCELELLQSFEKTDKDLRGKLDECINDKIEITKLIDLYKEKVHQKKLELDLWDEKATGLMQEFDTLASISPIHRECLEKIYMRKVKLYDDNYYSSDEDEDDGDDSFYDSDDELDCCPKGCPVDIYTEILELREKRIHQDDERKLSQRQFENLKRTHDQNCSKLRQSEKHFEQLQTQIQIFEDKKHGVLNEISVDIPLVVNQVNVWEDGSSEIPGTQAPLTECVLFPHNDLAKLVKRSHDIAEEINQDRIGVKNLRKELTRRTKDKRSLEESIILQKKRCEELQMLKFGQKVDIDTLDKLSETSSCVTSQSQNSKIHETAQEYEKQMNELETKNKELKNQLKNITNESTEILNQIVDFSKKQNTLMKAHQNISEKENESGEASKVNESEILHLRRMAINQVTEIERLEYDINKLKRKGGCIYGDMNH